MYQKQVDRILQKAKVAGVKLAPVITQEELVQIENELHIQLPESYKVFLTRVQNGGASNELNKGGPYYGIYPIEESLKVYREWGVDLAQKFPLTEDLDYGELYHAESDWDRHVWRCENDEKYKEDIQQVLDKYQNTSMLEGTLPVCDYGCGDFFRLVVTGDNAGEVWVDSGVINDTGFYSLRVDILTFFENWLDRQIEILSNPAKELVNAWHSFLEFGNNNRYHKNLKDYELRFSFLEKKQAD